MIKSHMETFDSLPYNVIVQITKCILPEKEEYFLNCKHYNFSEEFISRIKELINFRKICPRFAEITRNKNVCNLGLISCVFYIYKGYHPTTVVKLYMKKYNGDCDVDVIKLLVKFGADIKGFRAGHWNAFDHAMQYGHIELIKYLVDIGMPTTYYSVLSMAIHFQQMKVIQYLVSTGHEIGDQETLIALISGSVEIIEYLIENGADISQIISDDALERIRNQNMIRYLISLRANIYVRNNTILQKSAIYGHTEIVKHFLDRDVELDLESLGSIREAIQKQHEDVLEIMLTPKIGGGKKNYFFVNYANIETCVRNHLNMIESSILRGDHIAARTILASIQLLEDMLLSSVKK